MDHITKSEEETKNVGFKIAGQLNQGDLLALFGDLGSGKTTFVKGLAQGLGIERPITSPTFNIIKEYPFGSKGGKLVHVDAYRLKNIGDAESAGLLEEIEGKKSIIVIEWPDNIWKLIKPRARVINFIYLNENERKITDDKTFS